MNLLDIFIICLLSFTLIRGIFLGFVREVSSIIAILSAFYAAFTYYPLLSDYLKNWLTNANMASSLAFLAIFIAVLVIVSLIARLIRLFMSFVFLAWLDRLAGGFFGFIKGLLIVSFALVPLAGFFSSNNNFLSNSVLAPKLVLISEQLLTFVPKDIKAEFLNKVELLEKEWKKEKRGSLGK